MNPADLLHRARQYPHTDEIALHLAETLKSPVDVSKLASKLSPTLETDQHVAAQAHSVVNVVAGVFLAILGFMYLYLVLFYVKGDISSKALLSPLMWSAGALLSLYVLENFVKNKEKKISKAIKELELLSPIAGNDACLAAATYVESGAPGIIEWRDHALVERNQLYGFDVEVMRGMYEAEEAEQRASRNALVVLSKEKRLAEACRIAHGLPVHA